MSAIAGHKIKLRSIVSKFIVSFILKNPSISWGFRLLPLRLGVEAGGIEPPSESF